ncbi:2-dehydropantoate 2-reductase [Pendulispora albinea]|uniref:2-dehydropantoate 2-reductase n=1 Tax=Pendulispora albinea TaxID=2741071 RepID=A0ABZ2LX87_9BACT
MRIGIVGAGAIGGFLGARLALSGHAVTLIARGAHLAAIQRDGLKLIEIDGTERVVRPEKATANIAEAGPQDAVIVALKAGSLPAVAPSLRALYHPETMVITAQNGFPWWYFYKLEGPYANHRVEAVDPGGIIAANIEADRVIGCIVYPAADIDAPGIVRHVEGDRFSIGELDGQKTERVSRLRDALEAAGVKAKVTPRIRWETWIKLWGNLTFNPISALTRSTLEQICSYPLTRQLARTMMQEAQVIAERLGIEFGIKLEQRIDGAQKVGAHKTSMLQDIERGRPTEIDAMLGSVSELGRWLEVPTPAIDAVYAAVKLLEARSLA